MIRTGPPSGGEGTVQVVCDLIEAIRKQPRVNQGFGTHSAATVNAGRTSPVLRSIPDEQPIQQRGEVRRQLVV